MVVAGVLDRLAVEGDVAAGGRVEQGEHSGQGGFAAAALADEADDAAGFQAQADVFDGADAAGEVFADVDGFEGHRGAPLRWQATIRSWTAWGWGRSVAQVAVAWSQRGWKAQPGAGRAGRAGSRGCRS